MRRILLLIALIATTSTSAQNINPEEYLYPMKGVAGYFSANFGELRPDHFHSGVDIKSDGEVGKQIIAVNDGYLSRILLSPWGYGLALYVTHPDGATTVYGHLWRFREDIAEYVKQQRYKSKRHSVDLYLDESIFPVKRGELIAYSGNSGSSFGPHLHYEIRDAGQRPMNPVSLGIISAKDNIAPTISALYYVEVDSVAGVAYRAPYKKYDVERIADGSYRLAAGAKAWVGRRGYFVAQLRDRKNNTSNSYGIHKIDLTMDGEPIYGYQIDGFSFNSTRYCNAISDYGLSQQISGEIFRLAQLGNGSSNFYHTMVNRGVVGAEAGQERMMELSFADDAGNLSRLEFTMRGIADEDLFKAEVDNKQRIVRADADFEHIAEGLRVVIPARSLYESVPFVDSLSSRELELPEGVVRLSRSYSVMDESIPLHKSMNLSIYLNAPDSLRGQVLMAKVGKDGSLSPISGSYSGSYLEGEQRRFGEFIAVADTLPPVIKIGALSKGRLSFSVTDNFSGVNNYDGYIDDEWVAIDLDKDRYTIVLPMASEGKSRTLRLTAVDGARNESEVVHEFVW